MTCHVGWELLQTRRIHDRLTMLYKITNGLIEVLAEYIWQIKYDDDDIIPSHVSNAMRGHTLVHRFQPAVDAFKYYFIPRTILSWNAVYCLGLVGKSSKPAGSTEVFITRQHTDARY